jgi:hypothetical protein
MDRTIPLWLKSFLNLEIQKENKCNTKSLVRFTLIFRRVLKIAKIYLLAFSFLSVCLLPVYPSVRPSAWNNWAPTELVFMKFDIWVFFENIFEKIPFSLNSDMYNGYFEIKRSRNRPGVAQRVPGGLGSQISMTFGTWRWRGCQPHAPAAFSPGKYSWYSLSIGAESNPGPWYGRKEYVTEKSSDTTGNWSRHRPTSSAAP